MDDLIIFPDCPTPPEEAFEFLRYVQAESERALGLKDMEGMKPEKRTASGYTIDTMDKLSEQIKKRMGNVYSR
jgi:hypothetical protein